MVKVGTQNNILILELGVVSGYDTYKVGHVKSVLCKRHLESFRQERLKSHLVPLIKDVGAGLYSVL